MEPESATPIRVTRESAAKSPLSLASLVDLLFRPGRFFANPARLTAKPEVLFVAWVSGIAYVLDRIDSRIMQSELSTANSTIRGQFAEGLTKSWAHYWIFALVVGVISAWILWYVAGWWYRMRLVWSGASNPDPRRVRSIYVYQAFVMAGPAIIIAYAETLAYGNYAEAWTSDSWWGLSGIVFIFWSCATSYSAATSVFTLSRWKARFWFLLVPITFYLVAAGVISTAYMLAQ